MPDEATEEETADAEDESGEERETYLWANQSPTTRLSGTPTGIIYAGDLDDTVAQPSTTFAVEFDGVTVEEGVLFRNEAKPEDGSVKDVIDDDSTMPTDYRIADPDDSEAAFSRDGKFKTDEESTVDGDGANTYEEVEDGTIDETVIVWYNGLTGQRVGRTLDFNGQPFARWTDEDGYLIKGLFQSPVGWRDANASERASMAKDGFAPRPARAPILRQRVEPVTDDEGEKVGANLLDEPEEQPITVHLERAQSGNSYRVYLFDTEAFEDEFDTIDAELPRNDDGYVEDDIDSRIEWRYDPHADSVLSQAEYGMHMYTGEGFQDEPENAGNDTPDFEISADSDDTEGLSQEEADFVEMTVSDLAGTGMDPEERYHDGVEGLIGKNQDEFSTTPDVDAIEEAVYGAVSHLDVDDLEE